MMTPLLLVLLLGAAQHTGQMSPTSDVSSNRVKATGSTTSRALRDRAAEVFNVKDYGAEGDGATNDTTAIWDAYLAASTAGGGAVVFPPGTYIVSAATSSGTIFPIAASDIAFRGSGMKVSIIRSAASMSTGHKVFDVTGSRVRFEDLGFTANAAAGSSQAIRFLGSTTSSVSRCWFSAHFGWSVFIGGGAMDVLVSEIASDGTSSSHSVEINAAFKCTVTRSVLASSASNGVELYDIGSGDQPTGHRIIGNRIASPTDAGVMSMGNIGTVIQGNVIESPGTYGVFLEASEIDHSRLSQDEVVEANLITSAAQAGVYAGIWGAVARPAIVANVVRGSGNAAIGGITLNSSTDAVLSGNVVSRNQGSGIFVNTGATGSAVTGNVVVDNSGTSVGGAQGIAIYGSGTQLVGNRVTDTRGASARQDRGIYVFGGADKTSLVGNVVGASLNWPWIVNSGTNTVLLGNRGSVYDTPTVSGSRGGNAALASLLTGLANMGLVTDSSVP